MRAAVAFWPTMSTVNVSVVVKLAIESYTKELCSFGQRDSAASNNVRTHCPVPVPGENDAILV